MRAIDFAENEPAMTVAEYLLPHFPSTSQGSLAVSVESYRSISAWQPDMTLSKASFERLQDIIESAGELPERADYAALVDNTLAEQVAAALK